MGRRLGNPLVDGDRSGAAYAALEALILEAISTGSAADARVFNDLALAIHRFQRTWNAPYARYCEAAAGPDLPAAWEDIPAAPQQAFKRYALRAFDARETLKTFRTSGTTGERRGCHHFRSLRLYEASILEGWRTFGLPTGLPQIVLTPAPGDAPESSLAHMMGVLAAVAPAREQHYCMAPDGRLEIAKIRRLLSVWGERRNPVLLLGTALAFLHLFEELDARGETLPLPPGSRALETGGYKGSGRSLTKQALYSRFARSFGLPPEALVNEYGMTELSSPFYTRGLGSSHQGPSWTRARVIDPGTGREAMAGAVGTLRLFDLANLGSVMAIQTQDLAVRRGNGEFELLGRDPAALPRGCSRSADELLTSAAAVFQGRNALSA